MNRHKLYWSEMGNEPDVTHRHEMSKKLTERLEHLCNVYGVDEVITEIRKIKLREQKLERRF